MDIKEKEVRGISGFPVLIAVIALMVFAIAFFAYECYAYEYLNDNTFLFVTSCVLFCIAVAVLPFLFLGLKAVRPNEAYVFTLFGKYYGTLKKEGFFFVNPFCIANNGTDEGLKNKRSVSLRVQSLVNAVQKVNDKMGNPIMVGAVVIWKVSDPTRAVFVVDRYPDFLSNQADSIIRNVARLYPYDSMSDGDDEDDELTLRGSSQEIANKMKNELQESVRDAGLEILEVRINQLSYSEEIAQAMLQRQQAVAVIAARRKIVEGAVSMVDMALKELEEGGIVNLDDEKKAQMVSNLLVVLCGNKDAQPVLNSGSIS